MSKPVAIDGQQIEDTGFGEGKVVATNAVAPVEHWCPCPMYCPGEISSWDQDPYLLIATLTIAK